MRHALPLLLLAGCEEVPENVRFERMAAARLKQCIQNNICQVTPWCHRQSEAYCVDAGYPKTCGNSEPEGSCGVNVK